MPLQGEVWRSFRRILGALDARFFIHYFTRDSARALVCPHWYVIPIFSRALHAPVSLVLLFAFYAAFIYALHNAAMRRWNAFSLYACQLFRLSWRRLYGDVKPVKAAYKASYILNIILALTLRGKKKCPNYPEIFFRRNATEKITLCLNGLLIK